jgi:hypothetical protein
MTSTDIDYFQVLADFLNSLCITKGIHKLSDEYQNEPSGFSVHDWIERIYCYTRVSPSCVVQGCIFLKKIHFDFPELQFSYVYFYYF